MSCRATWKRVYETGVPNIVTAVLASYRGFDTLGEAFVIFTAGVGVMILVGRGRRQDDIRLLDKEGES